MTKTNQILRTFVKISSHMHAQVWITWNMIKSELDLKRAAKAKTDTFLVLKNFSTKIEPTSTNSFRYLTKPFREYRPLSN